MELATRQYRVSVEGKQCRRCSHYKRPFCSLTWTHTTAKGYCDDWFNNEIVYPFKKEEE